MKALSNYPNYLYLITALLIYPSQEYGSGGPRSQCGTLTPGHDIPVQDNNKTPYTVSVSIKCLIFSDCKQPYYDCSWKV